MTAECADGTVEPLASWLRVWDWSPVLPEHLLTGFGPLLAALWRLNPQGPADPRAAVRPEPVRALTDVGGQDLVELAAAHGPSEAARALAAAEDAGADAYAGVLRRLIATAPAAWTADVPAVLAALGLPVLHVFSLAAAAATAHLPGALPGPGLSHAVAAALRLRRPAPGTGPAGKRAAAVRLFADEAVFGLLGEAWRRPAGAAGLDDGLLPGFLAHLHALANTLTHAPAGAADDETTAGPPRRDPAVGALECLLDYAASRARTDGEMPRDVLDLLAASRPAVVAAIGARLPALHHHAPGFTAAHRTTLTTLDGPSPAAAWLHTGPADPPLLAALDRTALLAALRPGAAGPVEHLATRHPPRSPTQEAPPRTVRPGDQSGYGRRLLGRHHLPPQCRRFLTPKQQQQLVGVLFLT
ncbi:hypothetical protein GCM10010207_87860 [Streptomyces atratus]|uniref:hypothetical protein n=1 Tax=Streptomyces atratus TaxID=1893 RepID=UPI00167120CF|nr:hypothetical protein [Streptomyces atratus]GGT78129.1 hypothetical protein GCM10010207_87860 [Streptomyces atratus]